VLIIRRSIVLIQHLVVTLKTSEWSKITKVQFSCIVYKTLSSNDKISVKIIQGVVNLLFF